MLSLYEWLAKPKDKKPKCKKGVACPLCDRGIAGSMQRHMDDAHGKGSWQAYLDTQDAEKKRRRDALQLMIDQAKAKRETAK